jgi:hypothetical protein
MPRHREHPSVRSGPHCPTRLELPSARSPRTDHPQDQSDRDRLQDQTDQQAPPPPRPGESQSALQEPGWPSQPILQFVPSANTGTLLLPPPATTLLNVVTVASVTKFRSPTVLATGKDDTVLGPPIVPVGPVTPAGPVGPATTDGEPIPAGPVLPVGPVNAPAPGEPVDPVGPSTPVAPCGPVGPVRATVLCGPVGPVGPPDGPVWPPTTTTGLAMIGAGTDGCDAISYNPNY